MSILSILLFIPEFLLKFEYQYHVAANKYQQAKSEFIEQQNCRNNTHVLKNLKTAK